MGLIGGEPKSWKDHSRTEVELSWLLTACGFQVYLTDIENAGMSGSTPGGLSDLVVFLPYERKAAVIEVTSLELLSRGKLVKLHDRVGTLQGELNPLGMQVIAVACTGKPTITDPERSEANQLGVGVLTRSNLSELWAMAEDNRSPRECFRFIESRLSSGNA
jgi:hypothetical protein